MTQAMTTKSAAAARVRAFRMSLLASVLLPAAAFAANDAAQTPQPADQVAQAAPPPQTAQAQGTIEEVIVTSQKVAEPLSKVPVSVTAISQDLLDAQHIENPDDLAKVAPGLVFSPDAGSGEQRNNQIVIRGIVSGNGVPTVGVYLDDAPITIRTVATGGTANFYPSFFDLDRIEVLRGPQGTLFGVGSEGGTVRFITTPPSLDNWSGYAKGDISFTDGGDPSYETGVAVGGPIVEDKVGFRSSLYYHQEGGYIDRVNLLDSAVTQPNDNQTITYSGRFALELAPFDDLTITPSIFAQREISDGVSRYYPAQPIPTLVPGQFINFGGGNWRPQPDDLRDEFAIGNLEIKYDGFDWFRILSNTSYTYRQMKETDDLPWISLFGLATPFVPGDPSYNDRSPDQNWAHTVSQEFRFTSNNSADSPWFWQGGVYYSRTNQSSTQYVYSSSFNSLTNALPGIFPPNFANLIGFNQATDYDVYVHQVVQDEQQAVFGELHYKVIPEVTLRAGLRYEYDSALFGTQQGGPIGSGSGRGLQTPYPLVLNGEADHPLIPKFGIDWQIDEDNMVYFTAAKGARAGGPNTVPSLVSPACTANLAALGLSEIPQTFKPDSVWSYEIGSKNRFLGDHLQIDASAFLIDWSQIQQAVAIGCPTPFYSNLGSATVKGFDLSVIALPITGLTLSANVGYVNATSDDTLQAGSLFLVRAGDPLPNVLPWTTQVSAEYDRPITDDLIGYFRADYQWLSAEPDGDPLVVGWDPLLKTNGTFAPNAAYGTLNLRGGVRFDNADLSLYILNATNENPKLEYGRDQYLVSNYFKYDMMRPITIGFTATYRWSGSPAPSPAENFVAPPPPAPVAPPPAPPVEAARSFQVFFDFDKSDITAAAAKVIQAAADAVKAGHVVQITVTGHTDTVGSAAYNQGLSERRAASVKTGLVADGVSAGEITTIGVGKTGLLVPTADGVREPQNRRAEIVLE
jgi:outer membrane receptor protein involved in Fe transport/outer membrane protein OmpA-like peptidoglycan-associated protein